VTRARIRDAGDPALVADLGDVVDAAINRRAIGLAARVRAAGVAGVRDVVPTFRSVAVFFDPLRTDVEALRALLQPQPQDDAERSRGEAVEIPVEYGGESGPDLDAVAAAAGLAPADVVTRHSAREYRVFMVGFLPGFGYLGELDPAIAAPRHASSRLRVPAGSVGIAGRQTGVYPQASPGGWQIVGRTTARPFDSRRTPASLLAPGDRVRFVPVPTGSLGSFDTAWASPPAPNAPSAAPRAVRVLQAGLMTSVQDGGRWGRQHEGVPVSGAMDVAALRDANRAVGNPAGAAALGRAADYIRAYPDANVYANEYANAYANEYAYVYANEYADVYANVYADVYADVYANEYADSYADTDSDNDANVHSMRFARRLHSSLPNRNSWQCAGQRRIQRKRGIESFSRFHNC